MSCFFVVKLLKTSITFFIDQRSALALFVTRITRTDDPDLAVTFDDLAEFTSALHRRSNFHFSTPKNLMVLFKNNSFILFALRRLLPAPAAVFIRCFGSFFSPCIFPNTTQETYTYPFPETSIPRNWFVTPSKLSLMLFTVLRDFSVPAALTLETVLPAAGGGIFDRFRNCISHACLIK